MFHIIGMISGAVGALCLAFAALGAAVVSEKNGIRQTRDSGRLFFWAMVMVIIALVIMFFVGRYA